MKTILLHCQLLGALAAVAHGQSAQHLHYTVTDLGPVGASPGQPFVLQNNDLVGGVAAISANAWHAVLWFQGAQVDLAKGGGLKGPNSAAYAVNERAQAVGAAETPDMDANGEDFCGFGSLHVCQAFVWQNGLMSALAPLKDASGTGRNATAKGINLKGQAAGMAENTTADWTCPTYDPSPTALQFQKFQFKPVIWSGSSVQQLPTSGTDASGRAFLDIDGVAYKINDSGQAAGSTGTCTGFQPLLTYLYGLHAAIWQNGTMTDLGNLGGIAPGFGNFAYDINKWSHAVGTSGTTDGSFHAFFWSPETLIQDLGTVQDEVSSDVASVGLAINDVGDMGGISFGADGSARAFIRPDGGKMLDLNSLVPADTPLFLFSACSINARGEIIGLAFDEQGNGHAYLATPNYGVGNAQSASLTAMRLSRFEYARKSIRNRSGLFSIGAER